MSESGGIAEDATLAPGTVLGKYEIIRLLGAGGMGAVYEAIHREIGKRVAVKVLGPAVAAIPGARARFLREAQLTSRVRHPHIVDLTDMGNDGGQTFLVMEYLEGEDLARRLFRTGAQSAQDTADIMLPVLAAVIAAHAAGVTHRDLKPQNIFLAAGRHSVHPKVLDFGISKDEEAAGGASSLTGTGAMIGTPYYLAPEQILDARSAGPASDQYALGVILYECLVGERVFDGENMFMVFQAIVTGYFPRPHERRPEIPHALELIILRAMSVDPKARFASLVDLGRALLPFASPRARTLWEEEFGAAPADDAAAPASSLPAPPVSPPPGHTAAPPFASSSAPTITGSSPSAEAARPWTPPPKTLQAPPLSRAASERERADSAPTERVRRKRRGNTLNEDMAAAGLASSRRRVRVGLAVGGLTAVVVAVVVIARLASGSGAGASATVEEAEPAPAPPAPPPAPRQPPPPAAEPEPVPPAPVALVPAPAATYRVSVTTEPDSAAIELDGQAVATGYFERVLPVDHTRHTLRLSAPGYEPLVTPFRDGPPPERIRLARRAPRPQPAVSGAGGARRAPVVPSDPSEQPPPANNPNGAPVID